MNINRSWLRQMAKNAAMMKIGLWRAAGKGLSNFVTRRAPQAGNVLHHAHPTGISAASKATTTSLARTGTNTLQHAPSAATNAAREATSAIANTGKTTLHSAPSAGAHAASEAANAAMHAAQTGAGTGGGIGNALKETGKFLGGTAANVAAWTVMGYGGEWLMNKLFGGQGGQAANQAQAQELQQQLAELINAANQQGAGIPPAVPGIPVDPNYIQQLANAGSQLGPLLMQLTPELLLNELAMRYQMPQPPRPTLHDQPFVTYG